MTQPVPGLHHVTAMAVDPQANLDFYTGVLGLRLVKNTVNFDDPGTYHFYYADAEGSPGSVMTFFPFVDAGPGRVGPGMAEAVAFAVPVGALDAWMERLAERALEFEGPYERFGARAIALNDNEGLRLEIAESANVPATVNHGDFPYRSRRAVKPEHAIGGFEAVSLRVARPERTARVLTDLFGYAEAGEQDGRLRFVAKGQGLASAVDLMADDSRGVGGSMGGGTVHHVAFRARDGEEQAKLREAILSAGHQVTPVIDRQYFDAIYFREPNGVLFEVATDPPGFATDESLEGLGTSLQLPPRYQGMRERIERVLPPVVLPHQRAKAGASA